MALSIYKCITLQEFLSCLCPSLQEMGSSFPQPLLIDGLLTYTKECDSFNKFLFVQRILRKSISTHVSGIGYLVRKVKKKIIIELSPKAVLAHREVQSIEFRQFYLPLTTLFISNLDNFINQPPHYHKEVQSILKFRQFHLLFYLVQITFSFSLHYTNKPRKKKS